MEPPLAIREQPRGSGFEHEYFLHQRYFRSQWWRGLEVRSSLLVQTGADGRIHPCRKQGGTDFDQLALRGLLSAPDDALGCPKLRPASSANQALGPRPAGHIGPIFDTGIHAIEERWNGAPLLWWAPFRWVRRVNGVLSSLVTPRLAR